MAILARDKAVFYTVPNTDVGNQTNPTAGALGSNTNGVLCFTSGAYGAIIESVMISTTSTAAINLFFYIYRGTTVIPLGIVNVPLSSGNIGTVSNVDALMASGIFIQGLPVNAQGKRFISLEPNDQLKWSAQATVTGDVYVTAIGYDSTAP
jgi:hypothetical protein